MGQFHAWAVTGGVTGLRIWSDAQDHDDADRTDDPGIMRIATRLIEQQEFVLNSREGLNIGIHLSDAGIALHNGDRITAVWAAREGAAHGRCVYIENHTTGMNARLLSNVGLVRPKPKLRNIAGYGFLATIPAIFAILTWLLVPGNLSDIDATLLFTGISIGFGVIFLIGSIVAKLVFDYLRAEDEDKIWAAVSKAIKANRQPRSRALPAPVWR